MNVSLPIVKNETAEIGRAVGSLRGVRVELPMMMSPPGPRETSVLAMIAAGPLRNRVLSLVMKTPAPGAAGATVCPAIIMLID